jgi:hypothetical protein
MSITALKCKEFVLSLRIIYVYFQQIALVSVLLQSCRFVVLNKLAVVVVVL